MSDQSEIWNYISWLKKVSKVLQKMIDLPRLFTLENLCAWVERKIRATWIYMHVWKEISSHNFCIPEWDMKLHFLAKGSKALQKMIDLPRLFTLEKLCACVERNIYIYIFLVGYLLYFLIPLLCFEFWDNSCLHCIWPYPGCCWYQSHGKGSRVCFGKFWPTQGEVALCLGERALPGWVVVSRG